ncbi:type II toxin-antitoxin system RelE/ParE family toxin [Paenibacillus sp. HWE-109]|uniref:type II toxin-antitoxin system RelE/ParE family toxin n=1 Tax=Paenibacillus sp. HWE-109 TaxID=1306526 RepID=UPI001EDFFFDC|nr:type II toxin-antitoxin system RelE/ParE family toxin [Paenibacillus sp. HWE-109]UKS26646.1 type II toxin-antitoxin system RelE/ParE family toxin [Paenibacillus sp. HWE-109]
MEKKYRLSYLKLAQSDLLEIVDYISNELAAPEAALTLIDKLDKSIINLEQFPYSGHLYKNNRKFETAHRVLVVENYLVFYVVYDDVVEIRRILYGKRNYEPLI